MSKNYCIVKQSAKPNQRGTPDKDLGADYTAEGFNKLTPEEIKKQGWHCIYIHFDDVGAHPKLSTLWNDITPKCKQANVKIFYFKRLPFRMLKSPDDKEDVPVFEWDLIKGYLGQVDHQSHQPPITLECMPILVNLCQVYLAAHYPAPCDIPMPAKKALDIMGWTEYAKTEEGKAVAEAIAGNVKDTVQPEWWQEGFERATSGSVKTAKDLMKKLNEEWGNGDLPKEISRLVDAIYGMTELKDIGLVARIYLKIAEGWTQVVLPGGITSWRERHGAFNHNWLTKQFMPALAKFMNLLDDRIEDREFERAFVPSVLPEWESHYEEALALAQDFELEMSPRKLCEHLLLSRGGEPTQQWMGDLVHSLWLTRYPVRKWIADTRVSVKEANNAYIRLQKALKSCADVQSAWALRPFREQFAEFRKHCQTLTRAIGKFPSEVRIT